MVRVTVRAMVRVTVRAMVRVMKGELMKKIIFTIDIIVISFAITMILLGTLVSSLWVTISWLGVLIAYITMINHKPYKGGDEATRQQSNDTDNNDSIEIITYAQEE